MPSSLHESLRELVQSCGQLVCQLLRGRVPLPEGELVIESVSADFTQVVPTEYRADHVLALRAPGDPHGKPDLVVVVEVQLSIDPHKRRTWPVYVTTAASRHDCDAVLLVIAPDPAVARWARGPFGPSPDFMLHPNVISYADVPEHFEEEQVRRSPELAVLAALAHPTIENGRRALGIVRELASDRAGLYFDMILKALADVHGSAVEEMMSKGYEYQSNFARRYIALGEQTGREEGRREGQEEGLRRGQEEGRLAAFHRMALDLARSKLGELDEPAAASIRLVRDDVALSVLILELGQAREPEEARAALARAAAHGETRSQEATS